MIPSIQGVRRLIVECDHRLYELFKRSFPNIEVYGTRHDKVRPWVDRVDAHVLSGSLGQWYRLKDEDFPGTPYLIADPEKRKVWRATLDSMGPKPKIGIAWTGGRHTTHRKRRSLRLEEMLPILRQDAEFVSLEYRAPDDEIAELENKHGISVKYFRETESGQDYDHTAALVAELDLVISAQTSIIHLAGALGKETWAILPSKPLWRYRLKGESFPWAKCVTLYRQKREWAEVINRVAEKLNAHLR
jgi:ADP-heptose:LPS heptosyltransferase